LDLSCDHLPRDSDRVFGIGKHKMLGSPQQHVAARGSLDTGFEASVAIEPDQAPPIFGAALDDEWSQRHLPKDDDPA
jgi:hypothetical protein